MYSVRMMNTNHTEKGQRIMLIVNQAFGSLMSVNKARGEALLNAVKAGTFPGMDGRNIDKDGDLICRTDEQYRMIREHVEATA